MPTMYEGSSSDNLRFILDEPFHGYYIHGKAPSSRGDWGHTESLGGPESSFFFFFFRAVV